MSDIIFCIDSDGCVMDTMTYKHKLFFGPIAAEIFLVKNKEIFLREWNIINLYSETRGINRFVGLVQTLEANGVSGIETLKSWVKQTKELSNKSLEKEIKNSVKPSFDLTKALKWSELVNDKIRKTKGLDKPFSGVCNAIKELQKYGKIIIVSSANKEAVQDEWERHGLIEFVDELCCQDKGRKEEIIGKITKENMSRVLMIGDSPGDLDAAQKNGIHFYPILVDREKESWTDLVNKFLPIFLTGNISNIEKEYITKFWQNLNKNSNVGEAL